MSEKTPAPSTPARWGILLAIALAVVVSDQVTKFVALEHLTTAMEDANATSFGSKVRAFVSARHPAPQRFEAGGRCYPVVRSFWSHCYAENSGAAFSFARSWPDNIRIPFFYLVTAGAILMIGYYYRRLLPGQGMLRIALSLVMGGAIGNLIDRIIRGYVIDFVDWHVNDFLWMRPTLHWPTFNVADMGITTGIVLIALDSLLGWLAARKSLAAAKAS